MEKATYKLISAIDIGSNYIRMSVAQVGEVGKIIIMEDMVKPTDIGRDTFSKGKISLETIIETCETLKGFSRILKEYGIKEYKAVSTTGMREAENQQYVIEQIKLKTGIEVKVINSAEEKFYTYKALNEFYSNFKSMKFKPTLIVNITSGGLGISVYDKNTLISDEYIKIGSLRLREQMSDLESVTFDFSEMMEEFIESKIQFLKEVALDIDVKNFIGLGGELNTIYSLCYQDTDDYAKDHFIEKEKLEILYNKIITMSSDQIIKIYKISKKQEEILIPSIIFFKIFLEYTNVKGIYVPGISLRYGILHHMREKISNSSSYEDNNKDVIESVLYVASKYCVDKKHCYHVRNIALSIFDRTCKFHGLGKRERLYLEVAAMLHDIGKYINYSEHNINSYYIIKTQNITGLSDVETDIVANIARYHEGDAPSLSHKEYAVLSIDDRLLVSKLTAMLQIAEALDVSHKQKISKVNVTVSEDKIYLITDTRENILLEEWYFNNTVEFFQDVFGVKPIIKHKG